MVRPLVGITTYVTPARFGVWEAESVLVPADYVNAVKRAGGRPLLDAAVVQVVLDDVLAERLARD